MKLMEMLKIMGLIGDVIILILLALVLVVSIWPAKWYWNKLIPKVHEMQKRHPVITDIVSVIFMAFMFEGIVYAVLFSNAN